MNGGRRIQQPERTPAIFFLGRGRRARYMRKQDAHQYHKWYPSDRRERDRVLVTRNLTVQYSKHTESLTIQYCAVSFYHYPYSAKHLMDGDMTTYISIDTAKLVLRLWHGLRRLYGIDTPSPEHVRLMLIVNMYE